MVRSELAVLREGGLDLWPPKDFDVAQLKHAAGARMPLLKEKLRAAPFDVCRSGDGGVINAVHVQHPADLFGNTLCGVSSP